MNLILGGWLHNTTLYAFWGPENSVLFVFTDEFLVHRYRVNVPLVGYSC